MLQIRSIKPKPNPTESALKNVFNNICEKVDYEVQCTLSNRHREDRPFENGSTDVLGQLAVNGRESKYVTMHKKNKSKYRGRFSGDFKRIYEEVEIKNIDRREDRIAKLLQLIAVNKEEKELSLECIRAQTVSLFDHKGEKISINMETLYRSYLQFYKEEIRESIIAGNVHNRIIKPFLAIFQRIKIDSEKIKIKMDDSRKLVRKGQLFKVFNMYRPRVIVNEQIEKATMENSKIYEKMYEKYEGLPLEGFEEVGTVQEFPEREENDIKVDTDVEEDHRTSQEKTQEAIQPEEKEEKSPNQQLGQQFIIQEAETISEIRKSQIKQRFQHRFKQQIKRLSDDANEIVKTRFS